MITGIQVYFAGGRGALRMRVVCEVPGGSGEEVIKGLKPQEPEFKAVGKRGSGRRTQVWEEGAKLKCPAGTAVCGLDTKVDTSEWGWTDDTGINEIKIFCCDFNR